MTMPSKSKTSAVDLDVLLKRFFSNAVCSFNVGSFRDVDLRGATFTDASLEEVKILDCNLEGMTIEGIAVSTLLEVYESNAEYDEDEEDDQYVAE